VQNSLLTQTGMAILFPVIWRGSCSEILLLDKNDGQRMTAFC